MSLPEEQLLCGVRGISPGRYDVYIGGQMVATRATAAEGLRYLSTEILAMRAGLRPMPQPFEPGSRAGCLIEEVDGDYAISIPSLGQTLGAYPTYEDARRAAARSGYVLEEAAS